MRLPLLVLCSLCLGCATLPITGTPSSGERLEVSPRTVPSAAGWHAKQGAEPIDQEDFFRITGDERTANQIAGQRESALWVNRVGLVAALSGLASIAATISINGLGDREMWRTTNSMTFNAGIVLTALGALLAHGGMRSLTESPAIDIRRAERAAEKYNQALESTQRLAHEWTP